MGVELAMIDTHTAVNVDHVHLLVKYPPKYSVIYMATRIKRRAAENYARRSHTSWNGALKVCWAPSCFHGSVDPGWEVVER
ncbi:hypothetical protein CW696_05375 [ANME-2 cluster archaeon]|nr:MAG: hypothetical protein CW696_05375 [ANME-2 cluster archaeon]